LGGRSLSTAFPVAEVMLPGRHRLMVVYGREVSPKGTAIEVRLFRAEPFTISYLIRTGTLSPLMAAYLWMILESRGSILIVGETGSGKTSLTCALGMLIHPAMSMLTIEDIPELKFPHEHWLPLTTRSSYTVEKGERSGRRGAGKRAGEIDQFDLLRVALRVRPDFITVGEVIGEEALTLFQAVATGQGTITTLHSFDVNSAFQRLVSRPISTPAGLVSSLDCIVTIRRVKMPSGLFERRVSDVHEPVGMEHTDVGKFREVFTWDPSGDWFAPGSAAEVVRRSRVLAKYGERQGVTPEELVADLEEKAVLLGSLADRGVEKFDHLVNEVWKYYALKLPPLQVEPISPAASASAFDDLMRKLGER
jgi:flagellar protein FlaI